MMGPLLLGFNILIVSLSGFFLAKRFFPHQKYAWICLISFIFFFVPYILSALTILSLGSLIALNLAIFLLSAYGVQSSFKQTDTLIRYSEPISIASIILWGGIFYLGLRIAYPTLHNFVIPHLLNIHPFNGDALAGSLPILVDIIQSGSLWTAKSDYGHYLNGYELIQTWGMLFLRNESVFGIFHYAFAGILLFFTLKIFTLVTAKENKTPRDFFYYACQITLFSLFFFTPLFPGWVFSPFGKTDLPSMAFTVMAIYFFLCTCLESNNYNKNFFLTILGCCLFTAVKPQALYYFVFLFLALTWQHFRVRHGSLKSFIVLLSPMIFSATLYIRLKLNMGDSSVDAGTKSTLFYYFFMKDHSYINALFSNDQQKLHQILFGWNWSNFVFYLSSALTVCLLLLWPKLPKNMRFLSGLFIASVISFLFAPLSIWVPNIQVRYSLGMMPLLFLLAMYIAYQISLKLVQFFNVVWLTTPLPSLPKLTKGFNYSLVFLTILSIVLQSMHWEKENRRADFLGKHDPAFSAGLYQWIYDHVENKKIYFFLAKPFGLYGKNLKNELIYDKQVHSKYGAYDALRWADGIEEFKPDYFVYQTYLTSGPLTAAGYPAEVQPLLDSRVANKLRVVYADKEGVVIKVT